MSQDSIVPPCGEICEVTQQRKQSWDFQPHVCWFSWLLIGLTSTADMSLTWQGTETVTMNLTFPSLICTSTGSSRADTCHEAQCLCGFEVPLCQHVAAAGGTIPPWRQAAMQSTSMCYFRGLCLCLFSFFFFSCFGFGFLFADHMRVCSSNTQTHVQLVKENCGSLWEEHELTAQQRSLYTLTLHTGDSKSHKHKHKAKQQGKAFVTTASKGVIKSLYDENYL